jgi:transposase
MTGPNKQTTRGALLNQGLRFLRQQLPDILPKRIDVLSSRGIGIIEDLIGDWRHLRSKYWPEAIRSAEFMTAQGIGPIIASAMVGWLGLVPKQMSTGNRTILGRITKPGKRC